MFVYHGRTHKHGQPMSGIRYAARLDHDKGCDVIRAQGLRSSTSYTTGSRGSLELEKGAFLHAAGNRQGRAFHLDGVTGSGNLKLTTALATTYRFAGTYELGVSDLSLGMMSSESRLPDHNLSSTFYSVEGALCLK